MYFYKVDMSDFSVLNISTSDVENIRKFHNAALRDSVQRTALVIPWHQDLI